TQTMALSAGSVAVGAGNCSTLAGVTAVTTDQRGVARKALCDTGAYDSPFSPPSNLGATKTVSGTFEPGQTVTYTVTLTNNGRGTQNDNSGDEFSDTLPAQLTLLAANAPSGTAGTTGNTATWNGSISPKGGSVTITITATINAGSGGQTVSNQGTANYDSDGNGSNESPVLTDDPGTAAPLDPTSFTVLAPDVSVSKTATDLNGGVLVSGDMLRYTITVGNSGGAAAQNVSLTDAIPANTTYIPGTTTLNTVALADTPTDIMPFSSGGSLGTLTAGGSATVVFDVLLDQPLADGVSEIDNQASVSGDNFAEAASPQVASPVVNGLTILKQFDASHLAFGDSTGLHFTLVNPAGNPAVTGLAFSDVLPGGLSFVGTPATPQCGGTVSLTDSQTLSFSGGALDAGLTTCAIDTVVEADGTASGLLTNHSSLLTADGGVTSLAAASATIGIDTPPTAVPAVFFECENLSTQSQGSLTSSGGIGAVHSGDVSGNVYCHLINQDGHYITSPAEIGVQGILSLGVEQAVDVFGELPGGFTVVPFDHPVQICLRGNGEVLFLSAADASRTIQRLTTVAQNGYLCVTLTSSGTLILVQQASGAAQVPAPATPAPASVSLANCRVTTTHSPLNLRAEPNISASVIVQLPYDLTLTATDYVTGWYRVIYLDGQGWISASYVSTAGDCGQ
ncbi:MAG: SH3 domain-containing protein, partial [Chloroflexota bacterium]